MIRRRNRSALLGLLAALLAANAVHGDVLFVDDDAPAGGDGASWETAFPLLQDALVAASLAGGPIEIRIAQGTYRPDQGGLAAPDDRASSFELLEGVTWLGGYAGIGAPDPDARDIVAYETILSGEIGNPATTTDNAFHVVITDGVTRVTSIDGLTVAFGSTEAANPDESSGAGLLVLSGDLLVRDCVFRLNRADVPSDGLHGGGGAAVFAGSPAFVDCAFIGNYVREDGAGAYSLGDALFRRCSFEDNTTSTSTFGNGGGIFAENGVNRIIDCTFTGNFADGRGGGVAFATSEGVVIGGSFVGNTGDTGGGGAYVFSSATARFIGCEFIDNEGAGGGAINAVGSILVAGGWFEGNYSGTAGAILVGSETTILASFFGANHATQQDGGAIKTFGGPLLIADSIFSGNTADDEGGAIYNQFELEMTGCTLVSNSAPMVDGVYLRSGDAVITNTIVWMNGGMLQSDQVFVDSFATLDINYSCIEGLNGTLGGEGNIGTNPMFVNALGPDNIPGTADDDVRLQPASPCIDAGRNAAVLDCALDQDGNTRRFDDPATPDTGDGDPPIVDMGAYEFDASGGTDCDGNAREDGCEIFEGSAADCNVNGVPDNCDVDLGTSEDCTLDGIPDECQLAENDCNENGVPDLCDVINGTSVDCNGNGIPDACDLESGTPDCNANGLPDDCETDCNANGVPDDCDILSGTSLDEDGNEVPDECEAIVNTTTGEYSVTIDHAIDAADDGHEIVVAPGTYAETIDFGGKAIHLRSAQGPEFTIIDGEGTGPVVRCESGEDAATVIEGFTITGGLAGTGGGMRLIGSSPTVHGCIFAANSADPELGLGHGGGMYLSDDSHPMVSWCQFLGNAACVGGGMANDEGCSPVVVDCTFIGNVAAADECGGGIGGGMYNRENVAFIARCHFEGNVANGTIATFNVGGGGICNSSSSVTVLDSTFIGNMTNRNGGGFYDQSGQPVVERCRFIGNTAQRDGGGLLLKSTHRSRFTDCLIVDNEAGEQGGGVYIQLLSNPWFANCTITRNSATSGAGLYRSSGVPLLINSIIWGNKGFDIIAAGSDPPPMLFGAIVGGGYPGSGVLDADPMFMDAGGGDYRLAAGSPAIDAGDPNYDVAPGTVDLDGAPRRQSCRIDLGALESAATGIDCDGNGVSDGCDLLAGAADCDLDGVPDACQIASGAARDCNENGIPEAYELDGVARFDSGYLAPFIEDVSPQEFVISAPPAATGPVTIDLATLADLQSSGRSVQVWLNGLFIDVVISSGQSVCAAGPRTARLTVDAVIFNAAVAGGDAVFSFVNSTFSTPMECMNSFVSAIVHIPVAATVFDCNDNGEPDTCDIADGTSPDFNDNGIPDDCEEDCNGNGFPDFLDLVFGFSEDCNENEVPDECDIDTGRSGDCDENTIPDECDVAGGAPDCNGNQIPDLCDIAGGTSSDFNGNGIPDECEEDCNDNGIPDFLDLFYGASGDCNGNNIPDECDVAAGAPDCNDNQVPDACETLMTPIEAASGPLSPIGAGSPQAYILVAPPASPETVTLAFAASADLGTGDEQIQLYLNGVFHTTLFISGGSCANPPAEASVLLPAAVFNDLIAGSGDLVIDMIASPSVNADDCGGNSFISVTVSYTLNGPNDVDGNGIPDDCECLFDLDGDDEIDFDDLLAVLLNWGTCAACPEDFNGDGVVNFSELLALLSNWGVCS